MEQFSKGVHRALIIPAANSSSPSSGPLHSGIAAQFSVKILTQTDLLVFLLKSSVKSKVLNNIFKKSILQLDIKPSKEIVGMCSDALIVPALSKMLKEKVNAIAVTDRSRKLISTLSISNLRGLFHNKNEGTMFDFGF